MHLYRHTRKAIAIIVSLFILESVQFSAAEEVKDSQNNLKQAAVASGKLSRMIEVTKLAGLDNPEVDPGPLTLLAPSDEAFNSLPKDIRDRLLDPENRGLLTDLLLYHALPGLYPTERLLNARVRNYTVEAIGGDEIEITKNRKTKVIDIAGAHIIQSDIIASDGIIHVIDKVLIPPSVMEVLMSSPEQGTEVAIQAPR
ncbi:MAG: fasciclin domain-containing protein [Hyphomicrobium sp.]